MVTSYDLSHGYSDLHIHELYALDRSEKWFILKCIYSLYIISLSSPVLGPFSYYIYLKMVPSSAGVLCSVYSALKVNAFSNGVQTCVT